MDELNRATILGTGTMGPGMGAVLARAGLQVKLFDVSPDALERAKGMVGMVEGVLDRLEVPVRDGGSIAYELRSGRSRSTARRSSPRRFPSRLELKRKVFAEIEGQISSETIIASNTSGIPITTIAPRASSTPSG